MPLAKKRPHALLTQGCAAIFFFFVQYLKFTIDKERGAVL